MMRGLLALVMATSVASVGPAWAAMDCNALLNQGYDCAVPITPGQAPGQLTKYSTGVEKTGEGGFTPAPATTNLNVGDTVVIGSQGMSFITAGPACQARQLPLGVTVSVTEIDGCAAFRINRLPATAGGTGGGDNGVGIALGAAAVGGGVAAALLLKSPSKSQVSP